MAPSHLDLELSGLVTCWRINADWCFRTHHSLSDALDNAQALKTLHVADAVYIGHVPPVTIPCSDICIDPQPQG